VERSAGPGGDDLVPKSQGSEPGGTGEGGAPKSSVAGSRGVGPLVRRPAVPASVAGSAPSGRGVPAGAGTGHRGSEESRRDARNNRGPSPKAGDGVRGRDPDAMMLRSAEADPHITEHTPRAEAEAPVAVA